MSFNPDWAKEVQEVISLRKSDKSRLPPLYFNNATVKLNLTHVEKHLDLQLDNIFSFRKHINNKISKGTKGVGLLCIAA